MSSLDITASGSIDGNAFSHRFSFALSNAVEIDALKQAFELEHATDNPDGTLTLTLTKSADVPLSIPVKLPLGIKETLHEVLNLAGELVLTLTP